MKKKEKAQIQQTQYIVIAVIVIVIAGVGAYLVMSGGGGPSGPENKQKEPIILGVEGPLARTCMEGYSDGITLAVEEVNSNGGILGHPLKIVTSTTEMDPSVGTSAFKQLVEKKDVNVISGMFSSAVIKATQEMMSTKETLFFTGGGSPTLTDAISESYEDYKYWFHFTNSMGGTFAKDARLFVVNGLIENLGYNIDKVGIIADDSLVGRGLAKALKANFKQAGLEIVGTEFAPVPTTEFRPMLTSLEQKGADVIATHCSHNSSVPMVKQWAAIKINSILIGTGTWGTNLNFWNMTDGACKNYVITVNGGTVPAPITSKTMDFIESFRNEYKRLPEHHYAYGGYEFPYFYKHIVEKAAAAGEENPFDSETLIPYLENLINDPWTGVRGKIAFEPDTHELKWGNDYVRNWPMQWRGPEEATVVWPPEQAMDKFRMPKWIELD